MSFARRIPDGTISYVFVDNHDVFDTDELDDDATFRWAYEIANSLHIRTTSRFLRRELVFEEGDCYDPALLEESERLLRGYSFIASADVYGLRQDDGSWHVVVDTQDEWTTKVDLGVAFDRGLQFRKFEVVEENLLGEGYLIGAFYRTRDEERDIGGRAYTPRIFGTRLDASIEAGTTSSARSSSIPSWARSGGSPSDSSSCTGTRPFPTAGGRREARGPSSRRRRSGSRSPWPGGWGVQAISRYSDWASATKRSSSRTFRSTWRSLGTATSATPSPPPPR